MTDAPLIGPVTAPDLHVMSFNIRRRFLHLRPDSPDRWETRRPLVRHILAAEQPTLLGVQEALADQAEVVASGLGPHYRSVGFGRNPGAGFTASPFNAAGSSRTGVAAISRGPEGM